VKRWNKHKRAKEDIPTHQVLPQYSDNMAGVDLDDRGKADWGKSGWKFIRVIDSELMRF
jgi:hypothetical protein